MRTSSLMAAAVVVAMLGPLIGLTYADSDGYYCVGPGYIAYQFGMDDPKNPPRIYVVDLRGSRGIPKPSTLVFPPFQVHGMRCTASSIEIAASNMMYVVTLDQRLRPSRYDERPSSSVEPIRFDEYDNLGEYTRAQSDLSEYRTRLNVKPDGGEYVLDLRAKLIRESNPCEAQATSRVVETNRAGSEIAALTVFAGKVHRECGD